jgi:hypothetical protein
MDRLSHLSKVYPSVVASAGNHCPAKMFVRLVQHSSQTIEKMTGKREPQEFIAETFVNSFRYQEPFI